MSRPRFEYGQRAERFGRWRQAEPGDWVFGEVVGFSATMVTIKTNVGKDMLISQERATWKKAFGGWAIWAPSITALVQHIEHDERVADRLGAGRLKLHPGVGDFVIVHFNDLRPRGFISKIVGGVAHVTRNDQLMSRFRLNLTQLHWDDDHDVWRARIASQQESKNGRPNS